MHLQSLVLPHILCLTSLPLMLAVPKWAIFLILRPFYRRLFLLPGIASQPHIHNSLLFLQTLHIKCPWLLATIPMEFLFSCKGSFGLYLCTSVNFSDYSLKWHLQLLLFFPPLIDILCFLDCLRRVMNLIHSLCLSGQQWVFY